MWKIMCDMLHVICTILNFICNMWPVICDVQYVIGNMWFETSNIQHTTYDMWNAEFASSNIRRLSNYFLILQIYKVKCWGKIQ